MPVGFSDVAVCNMALSHVGSSTVIESLTENSKAAKSCKRWFRAARISTLEAYNWSFARKSEALATHSVDAPTNRWAYRYQWPSDCVAPRFIENPAGRDANAVPFDSENAGDGTKSIVTDLDDAVLIYTFDLENIVSFSMHGILMLSYQLGAFINYEMNGKPETRTWLQKMFNEMAVVAPTTDSASYIPDEERDASWIRDRS